MRSYINYKGLSNDMTYNFNCFIIEYLETFSKADLLTGKLEARILSNDLLLYATPTFTTEAHSVVSLMDDCQNTSYYEMLSLVSFDSYLCILYSRLF